MSDCSIEFSVICEKCGKNLRANSTIGARDLFVEVEPCAYCMSEQYDAGYNDGEDEARRGE